MSWSLLKYFVVFVSIMTTDFAWTRYTQYIAGGNALKAALWAAFIGLIGTFNIYMFIQDYWVVIPEVIGSFCGTYLSVKYFRKTKSS